ncbi:MAG: AarF/ABC1/UbiB kinase family protein [Syntrophomonadaceae bacterium]|nr:AarF/ABC1/UbiB kinase family protein [Syntrophomonadaceae bacterium]
MPLVRRYRHLTRYREIANVLARHGFGFLFDQAGLRDLLQRKSMAEGVKRKGHLTAPERVFHALNELGPTFVKMGQILSTRPDIIPWPYLEQLEKLQDKVQPFSFAQVQEVFYQEQDKTLDDVFIKFEPEPIASASIAQVHRAFLKTGEAVVVKVQRPDVQRTIEIDLEILFDLARLLETKTVWGKHYGLVDIVEEFAQSLRAELDFTAEGRNGERFVNLFKNDPTVVIPRVYWEYSTRRVLVMEYIDGIKMSATDQLREAGYDLRLIGQNFVNAIIKQIYIFGFFHSDPHPGNLAVLPGERIVFMDFGQVGRIDEPTKEKAVNLVLAMVRYDIDAVMRGLLDIGVVQRKINWAHFRRDISRLQQKYYGLPFSEIAVGEALRELVDISFRYKIRIPPEFALAIKCLVTSEGVLQQLDPQISLLELAEPFARRIVRQRMAPTEIKRTLVRSALEFSEFARRLPRQVENILGLMEEGEFKIQLEHQNLQRFSLRLNMIANRITLSILIASLIVGSSLIVNRTQGTFLSNLPIAEVGYVFAAAMGFWLVVAIIRSGRF